MSIFVSVASYCDPLLGLTLQRAREAARHPQQLHFGVVDQSPTSMAAPDAAQLQPCRLSYVRIDPVSARGPCWARTLAMTLYAGEDWFLQLDSHMDFDEGWDERLVAELTALLPGRAGAVISSYPDRFTLQDGNPVHAQASHVLAHAVKAGTSFAKDHQVLSFTSYPVSASGPLAGFHVGAGCLFAPGAYVQMFPYDPWFYFHGEEQAIAARLFASGWDIFHIPSLPIYHLYREVGEASRPLHWDADQDRGRQEPWWKLEGRSRARLAALVAGKPLGIWSIRRVRSMADYADFSGIDYTRRTLAEKAYRPGRLAPAAASATAPPSFRRASGWLGAAATPRIVWHASADTRLEIEPI